MLHLILTFIVLLTQLGDWYTTCNIINKGGHEQNPVAKWFMSKITMDGYLAAKTIIITGIVYFCPYNILAIANIMIYTWVLWHNSRSM